MFFFAFFADYSYSHTAFLDYGGVHFTSVVRAKRLIANSLLGRRMSDVEYTEGIVYHTRRQELASKSRLARQWIY